MKSLNLISILIAGSLLVACGDATVENDDTAPDPEFGLETLDAKDDSFAIRPGSPEADAVVAYVNQPLADDAAGVAFQDEIDTKLYRTAARNIAAFRAGDDGTFGTADDQLFGDITDVDRVRYVGRVSLMQLFELADAAGYFQRASVDCADYVEHDRYDNYYIRSYADLLEYENSRCTTINGDLEIRIQGTDLLPPSARSIRHLRFLHTINGDLLITGSDVFESIHFESLEKVRDRVRASSTSRSHTLDFAALHTVSTIELTSIDKALFPALVDMNNINRIELTNSDLEGFTALKAARIINITQRAGTFNVDFPVLETVQTLNIKAPRSNRFRASDVTFTGGFDQLVSAQTISMQDGRYASFGFPNLATVDTLDTSNTTDPYVGMTALTEVGTLRTIDDAFANGVHDGPVALQTVGSIEIQSELPVKGYEALQSAEGNIQITSDYGVEGFNALTTMGGSVNLKLGVTRAQSDLSGFNGLSYLNSISIFANNAPVAVGSLFTSLEGTEGAISVRTNTGFSSNPVFESLIGMGGSLLVDTLKEGSDMMPVLEIVDGSVTINQTPQELVGFTKLQHIEGTLTLKRWVDTVTGLTALTSIGGDLSIPRSLEGAELDDFLNRLTEFSGSITFN